MWWCTSLWLSQLISIFIPHTDQSGIIKLHLLCPGGIWCSQYVLYLKVVKSKWETGKLGTTARAAALIMRETATTQQLEPVSFWPSRLLDWCGNYYQRRECCLLLMTRKVWTGKKLWKLSGWMTNFRYTWYLFKAESRTQQQKKTKPTVLGAPVHEFRSCKARMVKLCHESKYGHYRQFKKNFYYYLWGSRHPL